MKTKTKQEPVRIDKDGFVRCRVCGCTESDACADMCSWIEQDLCSTCSRAVDAMVEWHENARRVNLTALVREYVESVNAQALLRRKTKAAAGGRR